ncbi:MAG: tRNA pseudouridine(55) synthase TruB [Patescibacteria group bacterium]
MIINLNKPTGITSFDCIRILKKQFYNQGQKPPKIGHAGTLDPFASGVLIICTNGDTKRISQIQNQPKEYLATIKLGFASNTYDIEGHIIESSADNSATKPALDVITNILTRNFTGEIWQTPPVFSAKKVNGQRAYHLARQGISVKLAPKKVVIYNIGVNYYRYPFLQLKIGCSQGTYIRSIAHDLGQILKIGAYCHQLIRTRVGEYRLEQASDLPADLVSEYQKKYLALKNKQII